MEKRLDIGINGTDGSESEAEYVPSNACSDGPSTKEVISYEDGKGEGRDDLIVQQKISRAFSGAFGAQDGVSGIGSPAPALGFGVISSSPLSYVYEPPDLSKIPEPNAVVAFKNVQKKDSTTKAKALEEIQAYVLNPNTGKGGLEDSIVEAWVGSPESVKVSL
ncbi:MAG: hypothetical protein Q9187_005846 [Circinaria calcarea]